MSAIPIAVEDENAASDTHLVGGQSHATEVIHGLQHVLDQATRSRILNKF